MSACRSRWSLARNTRPSVSILLVAKVAAYRDFIDPTGEVATADLRAAVHLSCHTDPEVLKDADTSSSLRYRPC